MIMFIGGRLFDLTAQSKVYGLSALIGIFLYPILLSVIHIVVGADLNMIMLQISCESMQYTFINRMQAAFVEMGLPYWLQTFQNDTIVLPIVKS